MEDKEIFKKVDKLLAQARLGDTNAMNEIWDIMQPELRAIARGMLNGERHTTKFGRTGSGLVNELWLRLVPTIDTITTARGLLACGRSAMRNTLNDYGRYRGADQRDYRLKTSLEDALHEVGLTDRYLIEDLWESVDEMRTIHPDHAEAIDHYYIYGLTQMEVAELMKVSRQKVDRLLAFAIAWLKNRLREGRPRAATVAANPQQ